MSEKVLFVSSLFSPFQVEFAYAVNKLHLFEYYVVFTEHYSSKRGKHWLIPIRNEFSNYISVVDDRLTEEEKIEWLTSNIVKINPKIIISGYYKGHIYEEIKKISKSMAFSLAFWVESPNLLYPPLIIRLYLKFILRRNIRDASFILAIGNRAKNFYKSIFNRKIYMIPYSQDLSLHFAIQKSQKKENEKINFLFSGQLVKRHNIYLIAKALLKLYKLYPDEFNFIVAGYGPEEKVFNRIINKEPDLTKIIVYDRNYNKWEDRIRPFSYCDVLIYPSKHSGWGLVIPEAMASCMTIIATPYVESARYYIRNGINGFLIKPTLSDLLLKLIWCINNKSKIIEMGKKARITAQKGTVEYVAKQFCNVLQNYL